MSIKTEIDRINTAVAAAYAILDGLGAVMPNALNLNNLAATAASLAKPEELVLTDQETSESHRLFFSGGNLMMENTDKAGKADYRFIDEETGNTMRIYFAGGSMYMDSAEQED